MEAIMQVDPKQGFMSGMAGSGWGNRRLLLVACFFLLVTSASTGIAAFAQAPAGNIAGTVSDPSTAVIGGATVTAVSQAEGSRRSVTTDDQGYFLISTLQPGQYKVTIEARGFAPLEIASVVVEVGQT